MQLVGIPLLLLLGLTLMTGSTVRGQPNNLTVSTASNKRLDRKDIYNLTAWQNLDPQVFKDTIFGSLTSSRNADTIQAYMTIIENMPKSTQETDLAAVLLNGYFHNMPAILKQNSNSNPSSNLTQKFTAAVQSNLEKHVVANSKSYISLTVEEQELWLMNHTEWDSVALNTALQKSNAENIQLGPLTKMILPGVVAGLRGYLDTQEGSSTVGGLAFLAEKEFNELIEMNRKANFSANDPDKYDNMSQNEKIMFLITNFRLPKYILSAVYARPYESYFPMFNGTVSKKCYHDSIYLLRSFLEGTNGWANEMIDSAGKPPSGVLLGSLNWIGKYDQCFQVSVPKVRKPHPLTNTNEDFGGFEGSYCDFKLKLPEWLEKQVPSAPGYKKGLKMGVCFPDTCKAGEVAAIMRNIDIGGVKIPYDIFEERCHNEAPLETGEFQTDKLAHGASAVMMFLTFVVIISTLVDGFFWFQPDEEDNSNKQKTAPKSEKNGHVNNAYIVRESDQKLDPHYQNGHTNTVKLENGNGVYETDDSSDQIVSDGYEKIDKPTKPSLLKEMMQCCSIYSNLPGLVTSKQPKSALKSLDGIRFFSMSWIILGHMYTLGAVFLPDTMANARIAAESILDWTFQGVYTGMLAVDTFFVISGLLVSYLFLKSCEKCGKDIHKWVMQLAVYYEHRIVRILPLYGILILVYAAFGKYLGSGPLFDWKSERVRDCNNNWWANLLFINNFVNPREMCLGWSWYLSNDMQFYIIAPLILIPLYMNQIAGYIILTLTFIAHWVVTGVLWSKTEGMSYLQHSDIFYDAYIVPYCRIGPYLIGLILGHIFYKKRDITSKGFTKMFVIGLWWLITVGTMAIVVYIQYDDVKTFGVRKATWSTVQRTLYETFSKTGWALAIAWIIFACNRGYAGFVGHILNWSGWSLLGRVTFAAYLVHPIVIFIYTGNRRDLNHIDNFSTAFLYPGYVTLSYVSGGILSIIFEIPPAKLDKLLVGKLLRPKNAQTSQQKTQQPATQQTEEVSTNL